MIARNRKALRLTDIRSKGEMRSKVDRAGEQTDQGEATYPESITR